MTMKQLKIDPELRDLLPPLTPEEYAQLEKNILTNGYDRNFPIMEWNGFIVDGHNQFGVLSVGVLAGLDRHNLCVLHIYLVLSSEVFCFCFPQPCDHSIQN